MATKLRFGYFKNISHLSLPVRHATSAPVTSVERKYLKSVNDIPGPPAVYQIPYIGFALHFKPFTKHSMYEVNHILNSLYMKYGPIFRQVLRNNQMIFLCDPEDIEKAHRAEGKYPSRISLGIFDTYSKRNNYPQSLGGLSGEEWYQLRKPTQQNMLRPITVARYFPLMAEISDDFVMKLANLRKVEDIRKELMAFAVEHAGYLSFNRRMGCLEEENAELNCMFNEIFRIFSLSLFEIPTYKLYRTSLYKRFEDVYGTLIKLVLEEVAKAKTELEKAQESGEFDADKDPHLLHQLLSDPRMNNADNVTTTITGLFIAGGETTASSLTFLLHQLALNKDVQNRLLADIQKHLPADGVLTEAALKKMSYVKAVVKESLRYTFPLPGGTERVLAEDMVAKGYLIPKGTTVNLCQNTTVTRNPGIFSDPDVFDPDRWLRDSDERKKVHSFAAMPFGFGPRSCIGQRFAEMEMHVCVAKIIQHLEISLIEPDKEYNIIYKPFPDTTEPVGIYFTPRK